MSYKIVRMYQDSRMARRTIKRGVSLREAQLHCADPETSSRTCKKPANKARTRTHGPWFDGYSEE